MRNWVLNLRIFFLCPTLVTRRKTSFSLSLPSSKLTISLFYLQITFCLLTPKIYFFSSHCTTTEDDKHLTIISDENLGGKFFFEERAPESVDPKKCFFTSCRDTTPYLSLAINVFDEARYIVVLAALFILLNLNCKYFPRSSKYFLDEYRGCISK